MTKAIDKQLRRGSGRATFVLLLAALGGCTAEPRAPLGASPAEVRAGLTQAALTRTGWILTASSTAASDTPNKALDGDAATRWSSGTPQASGQSIQLDMQAPQTFDGLTLDAGGSSGDYPRGFQVYASNDTGNFGAPIATGAGASALVTVAFPAQTARYLRVVLTAGNTKWWSIHELNVFGYGTTIPTTLPRAGWVASASSSSGSDTPGRALDGSTGTRWSAGLPQAAGQWFQVDMIATQTFTDVTMDAGSSAGDYPRGFQIFVSSDGVSFGSAVFTGAATSARATATFPLQRARYLRVVLTGTASNWWSIGELNVANSTGAVVSPLLSRDGWGATAFATCQTDVPANALDGKASTRWSSGVPQAPGQWFQVDLRSARVVSGLTLDAGSSSSDYPRGFRVTASTDGATFSAPLATGTGTGALVKVAFAPVVARYLRITQTGSASSWWSIHELNVGGTLIDGTGTNEVALMRQIDQQLSASEQDYFARVQARRRLTATYAQTLLASDLAAAQAAQAAQDASLAAVHKWQGELDAHVARVLAYSTTGSPVSIMQGGLVAFLGEVRKLGGVWRQTHHADPSCQDVVGDQLLYAVADAILRDDRAAYAVALSRFEQAVQCTTITDALYFNQYFATSIDAAVARFPLAAQAAARKALRSALLNLLLLVHDDTKIMGPTMLYDWFAANRAALGLIFADPSSIPRAAGFWLRDPSGSRLVQVRELCEAGGTNPACVSGTHLLDALTDPWRLGLATCSALEMVTSAFDSSLGYDCDKSLCGTEAPSESGFTSGFVSPGLQHMIDVGGQSQFGVALDGLKARLCAAGRRDHSGPGGTVGAAADFAKCITQAQASIGQRTASCMNDVIRQNAPTGPTFDTGMFLGNQCGSATAADGADQSSQVTNMDKAKEDEKKKLNDAAERKKVADAAAKSGYDKSKVDENLKKAGAPGGAVDKAKVLSDADYAKLPGAAGSDGVTLPAQTSGGTDYQIYLRLGAIKDAGPATVQGLLDHEALHWALAKTDPSGDEAREHEVTCRLHRGGCAGQLCAEDALNCGDCSPLAMMGKAFFQCLPKEDLHPTSKLDSLIYPTEDTVSSAWGACFAELDHGLLSPVSAACAATDCADGEVPVSDGMGGCKCSTDSSTGQPVRVFNSCVTRIHCGDDVAASYGVSGSAGFCGCAPVGGALVAEGGPIIP
jgi:hypothetical protein